MVATVATVATCSMSMCRWIPTCILPASHNHTFLDLDYHQSSKGSERADRQHLGHSAAGSDIVYHVTLISLHGFLLVIIDRDGTKLMFSHTYLCQAPLGDNYSSSIHDVYNAIFINLCCTIPSFIIINFTHTHTSIINRHLAPANSYMLITCQTLVVGDNVPV